VEKITVKKDELLLQLRANRDDHRRIFVEALEGFHREAIKELQDRMDDVLAGKRHSIYITKQVPTDHTSDYDRAIRVVEMSIGETIGLTEGDFARYVMDDRGWQKECVRNSYVSNTATTKFSDYMVTDK